MGYECPVCSVPQADGRHLANHLAFTALLGDADHGTWLDEVVPEWAGMDEATLADRVVERAPERPYPQVFEDTTEDRPAGGSRRRRCADTRPDRDGGTGAETAAVLEAARALTERRRATAEEDGADDTG